MSAFDPARGKPWVLYERPLTLPPNDIFVPSLRPQSSALACASPQAAPAASACPPHAPRLAAVARPFSCSQSPVFASPSGCRPSGSSFPAGHRRAVATGPSRSQRWACGGLLLALCRSSIPCGVAVARRLLFAARRVACLVSVRLSRDSCAASCLLDALLPRSCVASARSRAAIAVVAVRLPLVLGWRMCGQLGGKE